jgi:hypothetical protein
MKRVSIASSSVDIRYGRDMYDLVAERLVVNRLQDIIQCICPAFAIPQAGQFYVPRTPFDCLVVELGGMQPRVEHFQRFLWLIIRYHMTCTEDFKVLPISIS